MSFYHTDSSTLRCDFLINSHFFQVGDFSNEVMKSLGKIQQQPRILPRMGVPVAPPRVVIPREPDSGISSARSTTTVPWSHNDSEIPQLSVSEESGEAEHQF